MTKGPPGPPGPGGEKPTDTYVIPSYPDVQDTFSEAPAQAPWEEYQ